MEKILFIHGLASDRNSTTGKRVKEILSDYGEVIYEDFNPQDIDEMLEKLHKKINDEGFTMLVGHSFGGFWTLIANTIPKKLNKIVINPCYYPSIEIPNASTNRRPDIMGVRKNGKIDQIEVMSKTDSYSTLQNRMIDNRSMMGARGGNINVVEP